jgi:two-component system, NtrC family, response regulator AtoC
MTSREVAFAEKGDERGMPPRESTSYVGGLSAAWQSLESVVAEIAPTTIPVLLVGEIGTGKEVVAQRLHQLSRRSDNSLIRVKCATATSGNFLSHLDSDFSSTEKTNCTGTIFLDEIAELDVTCQRNLLYALPDGDSTPRKGVLRERLISATTRDLESEVRAGRFRVELFYRISGVCLRLPPLRERKEDIPLLLENFLTKFAAELGRPRPQLSAKTLRQLIDHSWPGNIRELENVARKIAALGDDHAILASFGELPSAKTPAPPKAEPKSYSLKAAARAASREVERQLILEVLARTRWNRKRAAQELQISYKSLLYKMKQIGSVGSETNS